MNGLYISLKHLLKIMQSIERKTSPFHVINDIVIIDKSLDV